MSVRPDALWEKCLAIIRENVAEQTFKTWFQPIVFDKFEEDKNRLVLCVPSTFVYEYIEQYYAPLMGKVLIKCFGEGINLGYRISVDEENKKSVVVEDDAPEMMVTSETTTSNTAPSPLDIAQSQQIDTQLDPRRTFKNYIEGVSNKMPRSVGMAIAENPKDITFNPFFVYGPSGCGKTHLINAIGVRAKQLYPQKRVLYVSARLFEVQYTNAMLQNKINDFIMFYQTIDLLIVDDVQEWENKKATQNTFFHIFNHLYRNGKHIILASDRPPVELNGMNERLITRFSGGVTAELERPNTELCVDILKGMIRHEGLSIPDNIVEYIAATANGSVRDLQGVVLSLLAHSVAYNCEIDMQLAERVLKRTVKVKESPLTFDDIVESVCHHYKVTPQAVNGRSRKKDYVMARQVSIYLAQKYTKMPASRIGKLMGGRDHSTIIYSYNQVEQRLKVDAKFSNELTSIENSFKTKK